MGKVGRIIAGAILVVGGAIITPFNWQLGLTAMSLGVNLLLRPKLPGVGIARSQGSILNMRLGSQNGLPVVYGTSRLAGSVVELRIDTTSTDRKRLFVVVAWCHGSQNGTDIQSIDDVLFDERNAIVGSTIQAPFNTAVPNQGGTRYLEYGHHLGSTSQTVDSRLASQFPLFWPSTSKGAGVAYTRFELWHSPEYYGGGVPNMQATIKGVKVYDPRDGTYKHSDNPALCIRDYMTSTIYGMAIPASSLDEQSFIDMANYCDELIIVPGIGSTPRYTCNGVVDTSQNVLANLEALATSCRAQIVNQGDVWRIFIRRPRTVTGYTLDEENTLEGSWSWSMPGLEAPNVFRVGFVDASNKYHADHAQWPAPGMSNTYLTEDNGYESRVELDLPFTNHKARAQMIGQTLLKEARQGIGVTMTLKESAMVMQIGDLVEVFHPTPGWSGKIFDVVALLLQPDGGVQAVLGEYDSNAYTIDTVPTPTPPPGTGLPDPFTVADPTGLALDGSRTQWLTNNDGTQIARIRVTWVASIHSFVDYYEVEAKRDAVSNFDPQGRIPASSPQEFFVVGVDSGVWDVRIRAVNTILRSSNWVEATVTVQDRAPNILTWSFAPGHVDQAHQDLAHQDASHGDTAHVDGAHTDTHSDDHSDAHQDVPHFDTHDDEGNQDSEHTDNHGDDPHSDTAHVDSHGDSHGDTHSDTPHSDSPHGDSHTDTGHADGLHGLVMVIQGDSQTGSIKAVGRKNTNPTATEVRATGAVDGRNVAIPLTDASTGVLFLFAPGDFAYVGILPFSQASGLGTEGPLALARTAFFPVAPVGTNLWVP